MIVEATEAVLASDRWLAHAVPAVHTQLARIWGWYLFSSAEVEQWPALVPSQSGALEIASGTSLQSVGSLAEFFPYLQ
jgi:hypothetical protein